MESLDNALSIMASVASLLVIGTATPFVPRVGFVRALTLRWVSRPHRRNPRYARGWLVKDLRTKLDSLEEPKYIAVQGGKGLGKSSAISTALLHTEPKVRGIVNVNVWPNMACNDINLAAYGEIARMKPTGMFDPTKSALRIGMFYHLLFGEYPIVLLTVREVPRGEKPAQLTAAVRTIADERFRIIADLSLNSTPEGFLDTHRQEVISVPLMSRTEVQEDGEFSLLFKRLGRAGLTDVVWGTHGGNPAVLHNLQLAAGGTHDDALPATVAKHCVALASQALSHRDALVREHPELRSIIKQFQADKPVPSSAAVLSLPLPNKVFRIVGGYFVPSTPAMSLVLRHGLLSAPAPSFKTLRTLCEGSWETR